MPKYKLTWNDGVEAVDPRITTSDDGTHSYEFEVDNLTDAQAIVRAFELIQPEHNLKAASLTEIPKE